MVILIAVAFNTSFPLLTLFPEHAFSIATIAVGLLFVIALLSQDSVAIHLTLLTLSIAGWKWMWPPSWPFYLLGPVMIYAVVVAIIPRLRQTVGWLRPGKHAWSEWSLIGLTALISSSALLLWVVLVQPDLSLWRMVIPRWHPVVLIFVGLGFALVNAAIEESVFRGVLMQGLDAALGAGSAAIILQAIPFGLIHLNGIPGGWIGVGMATIYGLMLGLVRRFAQGMLAPFLAHVFADVVIFTMLVVWAV
jgi:membrane protease YdiL (CAAX protease family)